MADNKKKFNPEGSGYDYKSAIEANMKPDKSGHWYSRVPSGPKEGLLLKGRTHPTWYKTVAGEAKAGYKIYKKNGRYWSRKITEEDQLKTKKLMDKIKNRNFKYYKIKPLI